MLPYWSTLGWKQGVLKVTTGASYGYDVGNLNESLKASPSKTVPVPPVIVPVQWKMLSPSGKAEMPESPPIMSDMSSDCSLRWLADRALRCASGGGVRGQSTGGVRRGRGGGGGGGRGDERVGGRRLGMRLVRAHAPRSHTESSSCGSARPIAWMGWVSVLHRRCAVWWGRSPFVDRLARCGWGRRPCLGVGDANRLALVRTHRREGAAGGRPQPSLHWDERRELKAPLTWVEGFLGGADFFFGD